MPSHLSSSGSGGGGSYTLPVASASVLGGVKVGSGLAIDGSGVLSAPLGALLYDQRLGSAAASFDVSSLDQTWRHLRLVLIARSTAAVTNTHVTVQFNGDSGANYDDQELYAYNGGSGSGEQIGSGSGYCGVASGANAPAGVADSTTMTIVDYAGTTWRKQWISLAAEVAADATGSVLTEQIIGQWRSTAAITALHLAPASGNFAAGSRLTVYGY